MKMKMMRVLLLGGFALAALVPARAETETPNLVTNGDFEQMKDGAPIGWVVPSDPALIKTAFPTEPARGMLAQVELLKSGDKGAYFAQWVKVEPNTRYRLSVLARMTKGRITVAVGGGSGADKLAVRVVGEPGERSPMATLFWDADWYKNSSFVPGEWRPVELEFDSGELKRVLVSFGAYFKEGQYSFDDVAVKKIVSVDVPK